ncbi:MAG: Methyltransferase type 11 [Firmicutes bacterium]|nr:Methyltransferase type 11 [Bacillota bacterium]
MKANDKSSGQTEIIKKRYNRTSAFFDAMTYVGSNDTHRRAFSLVSGNILEVGVGTGANFPYYPAGSTVTGIDFSPGMLARARKKVSMSPVPVTLLEMDAEHMDFPDGTFDSVIATCVFCSVPNPVAGLREIGRVCKPEGKIVLVEHMRSANPLVGWLMDRLNTVSLHLVGANINRRTMENITAAGLHIESVENLFFDILKLIVARP